MLLSNHGSIVFSDEICKVEKLLEKVNKASIQILKKMEVDYEKFSSIWQQLVEGNPTGIEELIMGKREEVNSLELNVFFPDQVINDPKLTGRWDHNNAMEKASTILEIERIEERIKIMATKECSAWDEIQVACLYIAMIVLMCKSKK